MSERKDDFAKSGTAVYAISNEDAAALQQMQQKHKADFITFLSDPKGVAARQYAGVYEGQTTLQPGTFVIGKDRRIVFAYINEDYKTRAVADEVVAAARKAAQ